MPMSPWLADIRKRLGPDLLLLPAVAAVIHNADGHVLLMRAGSDNRWSLPAGGIEPGETPVAALRREVSEETGLDVDVSGLLAVVGGPLFRTRYANGDQVEYTVVVFAARPTGGRLEPRDGEATELSWFPPEPARGLPPLTMPYPLDLLVPGARGPLFL
jgi:8-oxo-dGTP pyrophosphatase MutT (NUDIX family)